MGCLASRMWTGWPKCDARDIRFHKSLHLQNVCVVSVKDGLN
jgi:hypothetical protein